MHIKKEKIFFKNKRKGLRIIEAFIAFKQWNIS